MDFQFQNWFWEGTWDVAGAMLNQESPRQLAWGALSYLDYCIITADSECNFYEAWPSLPLWEPDVYEHADLSVGN